MIEILLISLFLNFIFFLIFALAPQSFTLAMARLWERGLILEVGRDRKIRIKAGRKDINSFRTKEGIYEYDPQDIYLLNGCPAGIWFEGYAKAVRPEVISVISKLKKYGIKTRNQLYALLSMDEKQLAEYAKSIGDNPTLINLVNDIKSGFLLDQLEYIKPDDVIDYLSAENPITLKAIVEREVEKERRKYRDSFTASMAKIMPWVLAFMMVLIGGVIAWKILATGSVSVPNVQVPTPPLSIK